MQGFILTAIAAAEKCTLILDLTQNIDKVRNEGQGHRVKVPASRVCQGQILCEVSSSQLPLLQRNELYF